MIANSACDSGLHDRFLELLPRIETHGKIYFRHKKGEEKAEAMQEMRALAWKWFVRENGNGKDPAKFMFNFTRFLVLAINSGRGVVRMQRSKDVLSPRCQRERGFKVESLPASTSTSHENLYATVRGQQEHDAFEDRLRDNTQTPVPEQAAFRIDWPAWMKTHSDRNRRIIDDLMAGEATFDVSQKFGICPARVSQMRREFHDSWERFERREAPARRRMTSTIGWAGWLSTLQPKGPHIMPQAATPVDHAQAIGDNGHKVNFDTLLESAQAMQTTLRELLAQAGKLIVGLKTHHRHTKALRDTLAGLRQFGQIEV